MTSFVVKPGASLCLRSLALLRTAVGLCALALPKTTSTLFGIPPNAGSSFFTRLFGARDLVIGALLWEDLSSLQMSSNSRVGIKNTTTDDAYRGKPDARSMLRRMLWIGIAVDAIDIFSSVASFMEGDISVRAMVLGGGAALSAVCLGLAALRGGRPE